jgi:hypothetical protein
MPSRAIETIEAIEAPYEQTRRTAWQIRYTSNW